MGCGAAVAAVAFGAVLVEKHFTLSRAEGGVDSAFSLEPAELAQLRIETERAWQALGAPSFGVSQAEVASMRFRRSLYVVEDMAAGEVLSATNLRTIRPGYGLAPKHLDELIGLPVTQAVTRGTPMQWGLVRG
jgi:sialic acid synthase SpsE